MDVSAKTRPPRPAFTLVELLVVIVIIGILAGFIMAGVNAAKNGTARALIKQEITQITTALDDYKNEFGEYPPDFTGLNDPDPAVQAAAVKVLDRHLRLRFTRYKGNWNTFAGDILANYNLDVTQLDSGSAVAFWLGGLPEQPGELHPAGFHADPQDPCKVGLPRTTAYFDIPDDRWVVFSEVGSGAGGSDLLRYYYGPELAAGFPPAPYVYFRSQRNPDNPTKAQTYAFIQPDPATAGNYAVAVRSWTDPNGTNTDYAVPYRDGTSGWRSDSSYQIVSSGLEGLFGARAAPPAASAMPSPITLPVYAYPESKIGTNFANEDFNNITSFADGKLENEL